MVSAFDYLERVLGYAPRTAQERLRVARALGSLPELTAALAGGEPTFSAVRELTRVATPATEASWIAASRGIRDHVGLFRRIVGKARGQLQLPPIVSGVRPVIGWPFVAPRRIPEMLAELRRFYRLGLAAKLGMIARAA